MNPMKYPKYAKLIIILLLININCTVGRIHRMSKSSHRNSNCYRMTKEIKNLQDNINEKNEHIETLDEHIKHLKIRLLLNIVRKDSITIYI